MRSLWQDRGYFSPATIRLKYEKKHIFVPSHYDDNCRQFDRSIHCAHAEHVNKILTIAGNQWEQKCNFLFCLFILSHVMQFEGNHYPQCNSIRNFYSRFCITILLWRNKRMRWWECTRISAMKWKENWIASITIVVLWSWSNVYHSAIAPHTCTANGSATHSGCRCENTIFYFVCRSRVCGMLLFWKLNGMVMKFKWLEANAFYVACCFTVACSAAIVDIDEDISKWAECEIFIYYLWKLRCIFLWFTHKTITPQPYTHTHSVAGDDDRTYMAHKMATTFISCLFARCNQCTKQLSALALTIQQPVQHIHTPTLPIQLFE